MASKILIVDDSPKVREVVKAVLSNVGYEVFAEASGIKIVDKLESIQPALLILDIMMPDIDGYTLLRLIRKERIGEHLPVIILSSKEEEGMRELFAFEGISGYMEKPFQDAKLIELVDSVLESQKEI